MPETTIAICDTEPIAIEGLRCLLGAGEGLRVIAAEECLAAGIDAVRDLRPDVVLLDKAFGVQPVLEALRAIGSGELRMRGGRVGRSDLRAGGAAVPACGRGWRGAQDRAPQCAARLFRLHRGGRKLDRGWAD